MRPAFMPATGHTKAEAEGSESKSKARSHVERCVLSLRKFRILFSRIPVALFPLMDDMVIAPYVTPMCLYHAFQWTSF